MCGLSPLARGTLDPREKIRLERRFIPAGAGNTGSQVLNTRNLPVYPRWRGEHPLSDRRAPSGRGLSPLARGTLLLRVRQYLAVRFIPAGAGNTFMPIITKSLSAVYPRWRGEHMPCLERASFMRGLSPLARGTLSRHARVSFCARFIPAGAGNTRHHDAACRFPPVYPRWRGEHEQGQILDARNSGLSPLARGTQR
ncbi:Domain of uncharacterised function (DUF2825) [Serratia entomophila]|nr:Domain of uncharacterised function (DUF2825) [Serratia entomophila]CAI1801855.1 Domain of uncharacterised function (DUF2825) [Serratia entomophila]CAI1835041.1 Domain of uncharacterised function (DUF2825) [Serratia entomophila]CAI1859521.1 Domain of uncharacterised function (DUF2825) [Serratia entomophila]